MRHHDYTLQFGKSDTARVRFTACWHVGNPACRTKHITELMENCALHRIPWVHLGDTIEAICPLDPRFHMESHSETILQQINEAAALTMPGRKWLIGCHIGNHEDKLTRVVGDLTHEYLRQVFGNDDAVVK